MNPDLLRILDNLNEELERSRKLIEDRSIKEHTEPLFIIQRLNESLGRARRLTAAAIAEARQTRLIIDDSLILRRFVE